MAKTVLQRAKELDFKTEQEYYDYIAESVINGNRKQAADLFSVLDSDDRRLCLEWMRGTLSTTQYLEVVADLMAYA